MFPAKGILPWIGGVGLWDVGKQNLHKRGGVLAQVFPESGQRELDQASSGWANNSGFEEALAVHRGVILFHAHAGGNVVDPGGAGVLGHVDEKGLIHVGEVAQGGGMDRGFRGGGERARCRVGRGWPRWWGRWRAARCCGPLAES